MGCFDDVIGVRSYLRAETVNGNIQYVRKRQHLVWIVCGISVLCLGSFGWTWYRNTTDVTRALNNGHYGHAAKMLESRLAENDWGAMNGLANLLVLGLGVDRDYQRAASLYSQAAFAGHLDAQINLGHVYSRGLGLPQDKEIAYAWFNYARTQGSDIAQTYMSEMLAGHEISAHFIPAIKAKYATIETFPQLH